MSGFDQDPNSDISPNSSESRSVPSHFSAKLYGGIAVGMAAIGGVETAIGLPEIVVDSTFTLSGAIAVSAIAALVAERVMRRNQ